MQCDGATERSGWKKQRPLEREPERQGKSAEIAGLWHATGSLSRRGGRDGNGMEDHPTLEHKTVRPRRGVVEDAAWFRLVLLMCRYFCIILFVILFSIFLTCVVVVVVVLAYEIH